MFRIFSLLILFLMISSQSLAQDKPLYELQTYFVKEGRVAEVLGLMEKHAVPNMKKHGIDLVGAWTPVDASDERVVLLVQHKNKDAATSAWQGFQNDAEWKEAMGKVTASGGNPISRVNRFYLAETDYSPKFDRKSVGDRIFELRTYATTPKNLDRLHARFRDHTIQLFSKHGMNNLIYWTVPEGESTKVDELISSLAAAGNNKADVAEGLSAQGNALIYFLTHASVDAAKASFGGFRDDPDWNKARTASEAAAGGSLTVKDGVKSLYLKPTEFSPLK